MCEFSNLTPGRIVDMFASDGATCLGCGSPSNDVGAIVPMKYLGHAIVDGFGVCDVFEYTENKRCPHCGYTPDQWIKPCGGMTSDVFVSVRISQHIDK